MIGDSVIESIISDSLQNEGFEVVRVMSSKMNDTSILQIMIDRLDRSKISISDCEKASKIISLLLDVHANFTDKYNLEVSSPGLDRPLSKISDYERFTGSDVKITLHNLIAERKRINGNLLGVKDKKTIIIKMEGYDQVEIDFADIKSANLVTNVDFKTIKQLKKIKRGK